MDLAAGREEETDWASLPLFAGKHSSLKSEKKEKGVGRRQKRRKRGLLTGMRGRNGEIGLGVRSRNTRQE